MKFTIITHAIHKIKDKEIYAYEPYVREMNLWIKYVDGVEIVAPFSTEEVTSIESPYHFNNRHSVLGTESHDLKMDKQIATSQTPRNDEIKLIKIPEFDVTSFKNGLKAIFKIPRILWIIYKAMKRADHIHLRCPGNIGLLSCIVQIGFPSKSKTIKYAGNWDPKSKQPLSYKLQKWILSTTFLTRNAKVLVYGKWPNQSNNIVPFFTASYSEKEISEQEEQISSQTENDNILNFLFVGALTKGKQPLLSVQVIQQLKQKGYKAQLNMYGDGEQRGIVEKYIVANNLQNEIVLHGNKPKEIVKKAYQNTQFLLFISKSEGWPKVVAEAMFWGCLPITSNVSCVPYMLDNGKRGAIVNPNIEEIVFTVEDYILHKEKYVVQVVNAKKWSQKFTLEKFEEEIGKLL